MSLVALRLPRPPVLPPPVENVASDSDDDWDRIQVVLHCRDGFWNHRPFRPEVPFILTQVFNFSHALVGDVLDFMLAERYTGLTSRFSLHLGRSFEDRPPALEETRPLSEFIALAEEGSGSDLPDLHIWRLVSLQEDDQKLVTPW